MKVSFVYIILFLSFTSIYPQELFSASSSERGIKDFDYDVTEIIREETFSILYIANFQERSARASRWMMCMYTELAMERGFDYWSSIYTDDSGDSVVVVFPSSNSSSDIAFNDIDLLGNEPTILPVSKFIDFCCGYYGMDQQTLHDYSELKKPWWKFW